MAKFRTAASSGLAGSIAKTRVVRLAALAPLILLHVAGLILLVVTERSFIGAGLPASLDHAELPWPGARATSDHLGADLARDTAGADRAVPLQV